MTSSLHSYCGTETPIFNAVMHVACRCRQYKAGVSIYKKLCSLNVTKTSPTFTAAIVIFSSLKQYSAVREIWSEARASLELDEFMAGARIAAAAAEADIEAAATVLDDMNRTGVDIHIGHMTSAIHACWGTQGSNHNAAK